MMRFSYWPLMALLVAGSFGAQASELIISGYVPARYIGGAKNDLVLSSVVMEKGVIQAVIPWKKLGSNSGKGEKPPQSWPKAAWSKFPNIVLKADKDSDYDVIYPAMINLHQHPKQNILPIWKDARGQFQNRFEWREWTPYKAAVSANMNPWSEYSPVVECATSRFTEIQQLVAGTGYSQGFSSCIEGYGIERIEEPQAFRTEKGAERLTPQAPTDLIFPDEMSWAWKAVMPKMLELAKLPKNAPFEAAIAKGVVYEHGLHAYLNARCPKLRTTIRDVNGDAEVKLFRSTATMDASCKHTDDPKEKTAFLRFMAEIHPGIASRKRYLMHPKSTGVVAHIGEGRAKDSYNRHEWRLLTFFGMDLPGLHIVHGVGLDARAFARMAKQRMGLVWSPYSNLLLYGETADILTARKYKIPIALGSDWAPTGSRSILDELKIARDYVRAAATKIDAYKVFDDFSLYQMVTENPAMLLRSLESNPGDGIHGGGAVRPDAMGTLTIMSRRYKNPYTNFVTASTEDVRLVVIAGRAQYGNYEYLKRAYGPRVPVEPMPAYFDEVNRLSGGSLPAPPVAPPKTASAEEKSAYLAALARQTGMIAKAAAGTRWKPVNVCGFKEQKALLRQKTENPHVRALDQASGLDLDKFSDVVKFLGIAIKTQSRNALAGDINHAVWRVPSIYQCGNPDEAGRAANFFRGVGEFFQNSRNRKALRSAQNLDREGSVPRKMADMFSLPYED